jgi:hypothetical protein
MIKVSEYGPDQKQQIYDEIESKANQLGQDIWKAGGNSVSIPNRFGICSSCKHLQYSRTSIRTVILRCPQFKKNLREDDPIEECTEHSAKLQLSLEQMWAIATLIDPPKKKAGFIDEPFIPTFRRSNGKVVENDDF